MFEVEESHSKEAAKYAGSMAGEYLESIGKFSLEEMSGEEWQTFCEVMCCNFKMKEMELNTEAPF